MSANRHGNPMGDYPVPTVLLPDPRLPFAMILEATVGKAEAMAYLMGEDPEPPFVLLNVRAEEPPEYGARMAVARVTDLGHPLGKSTAVVAWVGAFEVPEHPASFLAMAKLTRFDTVEPDVKVGDVARFQDLARMSQAFDAFKVGAEAVLEPLQQFGQAVSVLGRSLK